MTDKKKVALLYGGRGLEHEVSVSGAKNLFSLIDRKQFDIYPIYIKKDGSFVFQSPAYDSYISTDSCELSATPSFSGFVTSKGERIHIDCAFPLLHGDFGEDGTIQGFLSTLGIPFVGSPVCSSALCLDKAVTKAIAENLGIQTVRWRLETTRDFDKSDISYPAFIKPDCLGSSFGAGIARTPIEFETSFDTAFKLGCGRVLIEDFKAPVRELECAYFEAQGEKIFTPAGEVLSNGFYSYEEKYSRASSTRTIPKALIPEEVGRKIREYSRLLCSFIGIRHLARIDFFLCGKDLYLNEINTIPGLTPNSLYLSLLNEAKISPEEAINRMISDAIEAGSR